VDPAAKKQPDYRQETLYRQRVKVKDKAQPSEITRALLTIKERKDVELLRLSDRATQALLLPNYTRNAMGELRNYWI